MPVVGAILVVCVVASVVVCAVATAVVGDVLVVISAWDVVLYTTYDVGTGVVVVGSVDMVVCSVFVVVGMEVEGRVVSFSVVEEVVVGSPISEIEKGTRL